jgi:bifunctional non-homologous end joining protein LigD
MGAPQSSGAHTACVPDNHEMAEQVELGHDPRYTASSTVDREGRLFIDCLRNGRGNTAVGAYSPRARPRFPVSMPVSWSRVAKGISADAYTLHALIEYHAGIRSSRSKSAGPERT